MSGKLVDLVRAVAAAYIIWVGVNCFYHVGGYVYGCHKVFIATHRFSGNDFLEGYSSARNHIEKLDNYKELLTPLGVFLLPQETIDESLKEDTSSHQPPDINNGEHNKNLKYI